MQAKKQYFELDREQWTGSKLGKEYANAVYCHPAYLKLCRKGKARLDELQAGIKIARRNINSLRYADDTKLMAESETELRSPLIRAKEESEKTCLKFSIKTKHIPTKIMAFGPITS